jgi:hypothetical protein
LVKVTNLVEISKRIGGKSWHSELHLTQASASQLFLSINHALLNMGNRNCISSILCSSIYFRIVYYKDKTTHLAFIKTINKRSTYVRTSSNVGMPICATFLEYKYTCSKHFTCSHLFKKKWKRRWSILSNTE